MNARYYQICDWLSGEKRGFYNHEKEYEYINIKKIKNMPYMEQISKEEQCDGRTVHYCNNKYCRLVDQV